MFVLNLVSLTLPSPDVNNTFTVTNTDPSFTDTFTVRGLKPNTNYTAKVRAVSTHLAVGGLPSPHSVMNSTSLLYWDVSVFAV